MGYCASGDGVIKLKEPLPTDFQYHDVFDEFDYDEERKDIYVSYSGKYYEEDIYDFTEKIEPYTESGYINFSGEDECVWRFKFVDGEWREESARIVYESDPAVILFEEQKTDLIGQLIACIQDVLSDGKPSDTFAEGATYDQLSRRLTETLVNWRIL